MIREIVLRRRGKARHFSMKNPYRSNRSPYVRQLSRGDNKRKREIAFEAMKSTSTAFVGASGKCEYRSDISSGTQFGGVAFRSCSIHLGGSAKLAVRVCEPLFTGAISLVVELQPAGAARFKSAFPFLQLSLSLFLSLRRGRGTEMLGRGVRWARIIISSLLRSQAFDSHLACLRGC